MKRNRQQKINAKMKPLCYNKIIREYSDTGSAERRRDEKEKDRPDRNIRSKIIFHVYGKHGDTGSDIHALLLDIL